MFPTPTPPFLRALYTLFLLPICLAGAPEKKTFDIPAGDAKSTLKLFADQSNEQVLYSVDAIGGVRTNALKGSYRPREGLEKMLEGTSLSAAEDPLRGALSVVKEADVKNVARAESRSDRPNRKKDASSDTDDTVVLSPFTVQDSKSVGYLATSTLAGTRIKTELKDLGAAISVVTSEFLSDTAATDAGSLLSYTTNSEVGGQHGNFTGAENAEAGRYFQSEARTNPQFNQRIRGLGEAALTRGYFLSEVPFDSYNTSSVTISRGPNSLLFGIGSPGGIINNDLKTPIFGDNFVEASIRVGSHGSTRVEADINQELVKNRVGVRIAALREDEKYQQKPAWESDKRLYGALEVVLLENKKSPILGRTVLKANAETGNARGSPVEVIPPSRAYDNWFAPVPANIQQYTGVAPFPTVVSPSQGGTWKKYETFNPFVISLESDINTNVHPSFFQRIPIIYNQANASRPSIGLSGPDPLGQVTDLSVLAGMLAASNWNPNNNTVATAGLTGTPGVQPLVAAAGGNPAIARLGTHQLYHSNSPYGESFTAGFAVPTLQSREVFDYHNLLYSGGVDRVERDFRVHNIALEQTFFDGKGGIEVAYDRQTYESRQDFLFAGGGGTSSAGPYDIYIDINQYLMNGLPNPNMGRAYSRVSGTALRNKRWDRETARATVFAELDFTKRDGGWLRHLGRHRLVGLFSRDTSDTFAETLIDSWVSATENLASIANSSLKTQARRRLNVAVYTSAPLFNVQSMDDIRLDQIRIQRPQPGDTYEILYADVRQPTAAGRRAQSGPMTLERVIETQIVGRQKMRSQAASWQSYLLDNHVVGLLGVRKDDTRSFDTKNPTQLGFSNLLADGTWNPAATVLTDAPVFEESGTTVTWSAIARFPEKWLFDLPFGSDLQAHYAESENFNPIGLRNDALGAPIPQPTGTTREYGISVDLLEGRISTKLNFFETALENVGAGGFANIGSFYAENMNKYLLAQKDGAPFSAHRVLVGIEPWASNITTYQQFFDVFTGAVPPALLAALNPTYSDTNGDGIRDFMTINRITNQGDTSDRIAKGMEFEVVANLTKNWRMLANVSRQETLQNNTAPVNWPLAQAFLDKMVAGGVMPLVLDPSGTGGGLVRSLGSQWLQGAMADIRSIRARDGVQANEQREWRFSLVSKYSFSRGPLNGLGIGGAARWEDQGVTGYRTFLVEGNIPVPDVNTPFYDDGLFSGDVFVSYQRKLLDRYDWRIQLNVRNAIVSDDDIPVKTNPDGNVAVVRIPNPTTWYLSNSIRF